MYFPKSVITLLAVASSALAITINQPSSSLFWVQNTSNTIAWTFSSTDPNPVDITVTNSNSSFLNGVFSIARNLDVSNGSFTVTNVTLVVASGYVVNFVNSTNQTQIFASSQPFSVMAAGTTPATTSTSAASSSATSPSGSASGSSGSATGTSASAASSSSSAAIRASVGEFPMLAVLISTASRVVASASTTEMTGGTDEQRPLLGGVDSDLENSADDQEHQVEHNPLKPTWREKTAETLESPTTHKLVIALIAIDASCVLADLIFTFLNPDCPPAPTPTPSPSFLSSILLTVEDDQPAWLSVLAYISLAITTLFLAEIPLALWCFGTKYYTPRGGSPYGPLHLFDALVIITTFVLEAVLRGREREVAGLLVLLRLWRLVKLVGGIAVGAGELNEQLSDQLDEAQQQLRETSAQAARLENENSTLRSRLMTLENARSGEFR
ncbi:hypothetical protein EW145_g4781 [Phellinidium pouzarii]|uniref:Yeast cell wall synthesis Kre9/Knh1-like N-terminal domain-containing protein n=1 Tax=Phellinidium pouzarii TaxID=167371 RepID=A0A4S4L3N1_9AGAM|nr:hypothetical protein EW145_g4781 [Phellinidium pouzarii]